MTWSDASRSSISPLTTRSSTSHRQLGVGYLELLAANPEHRPVAARRRHAAHHARRAPAAVRPARGHRRQHRRPAALLLRAGRAPAQLPDRHREGRLRDALGDDAVVRKQEKPTWYPGPTARRDDPKLQRVVPPGPDNRLGEYALYLGWPTYLIHGTNEPRGVGRHSSRGCIRLYPEHIAELFALVEPRPRCAS